MEGAQQDGIDLDLDATEYMKAICIKPFHATHSGLIELKVGDIVSVLERDDSGWWGGHKDGEDHTGWFPGACVRALPDQYCGQPAVDATYQGSSTGLRNTTTANAEPKDLKPMGMAEDASPKRTAAPETEGASPRRRSRQVASPQLRSSPVAHLPQTGEAMIPGTPWGTSVMSTTGPIGTADAPAQHAAKGSAEAEAVDAEKVQLRKENLELSNRLKQLKRQSDADRMNLEKLELAAEQERQRVEKVEAAARQERERREQLEQQLQAANEERSKLLAEANSLHEQLDLERRNAQAQKEAAEYMPRMHQDNSRTADSGRNAVQSERDCVRRLEDQLRSAQEELAKSAKAQPPLVSEVAGCAARDHPVLPVDPRRRLVLSPASGLGGSCPAASAADPTPPGRSGSMASLASPSLPSEPAARGGLGQRPPAEPQSAPSGSTTGSARLRTALSAEEFNLQQLALQATTARPPDEEPARGIVAEKVTMFNRGCPKPRSASCSQLRDHQPRRPAAERPQHPAAPQAAAAPVVAASTAGSLGAASRPPALDAEEELQESTEVFLGMSPISRNRPRDLCGAAAA